MTEHRPPLRRLAPLLCVPLLAGCVAAAPRAVGPAPRPPVLPTGPAPAAAPLPPLPGPVATAGTRSTSWTSPRPAAASQTAAPGTEAPRLPPRRPGPEHGGAPSRRPMPTPSPAGSGLTADVCDGLAGYGLFPSGGAAHKWCRAQESGR